MNHLLVCLISVVMAQGVVSYQRGDLVRLRSQSSPSVVRVVAIPGDRIRADNTGLFVNDVVVPEISSELLKVVGVWEQRTVPSDHYFVVGEERANVVENGKTKVSTSRFAALTGTENLEVRK